MLSYIISSGESSEGIILNSYDSMTVLEGGIASATTVNSKGSMYVSSGGTATEIIESGGYVFVADGAEVSFVSNTISGVLRGATITVHSGTTASDILIPKNFGGYLRILSGGKLKGRAVFSAAKAESGSIIDFDLTHVMPGAGARIGKIPTGTPTYSISVNDNQPDGIYTLAEGANEFNQTITIIDLTGTELGTITVGETISILGVAYSLNLTGDVLSLKIGENNAPSQYTSDGLSIAQYRKVQAANIESGEIFHDTFVDAFGHLNISFGGVADKTTVVNDGKVFVLSGGVANNTLVDGGRIWISSGGVANNIMTNSAGGIEVSSGGTANEVEVNTFHSISIHSGGTAVGIKENGGCVEVADGADVTFASNIFSGLFLSEDAFATVHSGTTASFTTISDGWLHVFSGGSANDTLIEKGSMCIFDGGFTDHTVVNYGGRLIVFCGGTAINTMVKPKGGTLDVYSGGKLTGKMTFIDGAVVSMYEGAILDFDLTQTETGTEALVKDLSLIQGTPSFTLTVSDTQEKGVYALAEGATEFAGTISVVNASGEALGTLTVYGSLETENRRYTLNLNGDVLTLTCYALIKDRVISNETVSVTPYEIFSSPTVSSGGSLIVSSGGTTLHTTINSGGVALISCGGTANQTTINSKGELIISSGGSANDTTVNSKGAFTVESGGSVNYYTTLNSGGTATGVWFGTGYRVDIVDEGLLNSAIVLAELRISSGGTANDTIYNGRFMTIFSGGTATNTLLRGSMRISSGGVANNTTVIRGGRLVVWSGAANATTINSNGFMQLFYGEANSTMVNSGYLHVFSGGTANNTTVYSGGTLFVNLGQATSTTVSSGGSLTVFGGGRATSIMAEAGAWLNLTVASDGYIQGISDGITFEMKDATLSNYSIYSGSVSVDSGGTATAVTVNSGGRLEIYSGGIASNTTVSSGGGLYVSGGGKLTGKMTVESSAIVSVCEDGIVDFDLTQAGKTSLVNDLSIIQGTPLYTLTVDDGMKPGSYVYALADCATEFTDTITVVNASGDELGTLTVGDTLSVGDADYTLNLTGDVLSVAVVRPDLIPPTISNITASTTSPTNQPIILTADFTDDVGLASSLYRIGENSEWMDYIDGVTVTENMTVYFKAVDSSGNESAEVTYTVDNIDVILPEKPVASADITDPTSGSVTVTATFSSDSVIREYSLDGQDWQPYVNGVTIIENGNVYFRSADAADNISEVTRYEITNIYTIHPLEKPILSADIITPTNQTVTISATFDVNAAKNEYSIDNLVWASYTSGVLMSENGTVYFRSSDQWGNSSEVASYTVGNIDKVKPTITGITPSTEEQAKSVTITAEFADDVGLASEQYKIGENGEWLDYTDGGVVVSENVTAFFRAIDTAGNETGANYEVTNVDTTAPVITLTGDVETPLQQTSLTATVDDGNDIYYSTDNATWTKYVGAITVNKNGTYYFKATDAVGNEATKEITFKNIDNDAPVITLSGNAETPAEQVMLTATVNDGSAIYYRIGDSDWTAYIGAITVSANATYSFKATDAAGNTGTAEIVFDNILPAVVMPDNLIGTPDKVSWNPATTDGEQQFVVEYSTDNFEHVIQVVTTASATDLLDLPSGTYQWRVKAENSEEWAVGEAFVSEAESDTPKVVQSNEDGNDDLFFASTNGTWENIYYAHHVGSIGDWTGTNDWVSAAGKGRIQNLFFGSSDPNVLCLTDADNGDAIFVDDVFTDSPDDMAKETSRLYKIQEIRAGAGDDIVDMTSQQFEYIGDGLTIRGGDGNDTIWANKGNNWLFGDAGDDRIVGASGNDVIAGGIGNDRMHGGGGNDIFTFCDNWGTDTIEQIATGTVTLWFASELEGKVAWDEESQSYTDGVNHVSVTGVASVTLKFGGAGDDAEQFAALSDMGAFDAFTSQRIFEANEGILA